MHGRVEEKRLAEVCQLDDDPHKYILTVYSNPTFFLPRLKAFDHIDDDDSGYISKEVSSSVSDRIQVSQIRLLMPVIPFPPFSEPYQIAWGKCITFSNREAHQGG